MQNLILKYASYRVGFVGLGISNMPIAKLFCENGIDVTLRDKKNQVGDYSGFKCIFGEDYLNNISEDILFLSPAVRDDLPELLAARKNGVKITNELEEFFSLCPCKTIGVTGSDGKTTTTTLIAKILEHARKRVFLGGNIGKNLFCELPNIRPDDFAVCELSSFQLMKMIHSPNIAILKNIAPNHLDWHKDMDEYVDAKKNIFKYQTSLDLCILGADNEYTNRFACEPKGRVVMTSGEKILDNGVYFNSDGIFAFGKKIISDRDIFLVGRHNRYNYADAIAATIDFVSPDDVKAIATSFGGVKHRVQFVCEKNGIKYYNSSMDSSPTRTSAALNSFDKKVIVICGGYDKKIPLEPLGELFVRKAKTVVTMGVTGEKIRNILKNVSYDGNVFSASDMSDAVKKAESVAKNGDIIILSPAAASFDMYKNFDERGNAFISEVKNDL